MIGLELIIQDPLLNCAYGFVSLLNRSAEVASAIGTIAIFVHRPREAINFCLLNPEFENLPLHSSLSLCRYFPCPAYVKLRIRVSAHHGLFKRVEQFAVVFHVLFKRTSFVNFSCFIWQPRRFPLRGMLVVYLHTKCCYSFASLAILKALLYDAFLLISDTTFFNLWTL